MNRVIPVWPILVCAATLAFCASPWLVGDFGGYDASAFPTPQDDPLIQPPGWAFAIWGLIYAWLLVSAFFGLFARTREPDWATMQPTLTVTLFVGAAWLPVAMSAPLIATVLIFAMMIGAIVAFHDAPMHDFWFARGPIGLFAGWLTAATSVSFGIVLGGYGLASGRVSALIALALAILIAGFIVWTVRGASAYAAGVAWALASIAIGAISQDLAVFCLSTLGALAMAAHAIRARAKV